jgi:glutaredoxin
MRAVDYRQWIGGSAVMAGLVVAFVNYLQGDVVLATVILVLAGLLLGLLVWWTRPSRGSAHISHAAAQAAAGDGDVIVYWRPGCIYCDRLKLGLGSARHEVSWVNISKDPEAAEFVTTHGDGNETVPMAVTGGGEVIDATPAAIKARLGMAG